jgi:flagellar motor switch protein FliN
VSEQPYVADEEHPVMDDHQANVLKIATTLSVTVVRQQISLERVLGLVPGAMLTFTKHYADPMELDAAGHPIAHGEIVKIGDKFGIRILEVLEPFAE